MNRRGFLQALFAVPVLAAPLLVPTTALPPLTITKTAPGRYHVTHNHPPGPLVVTHVDRDRGVITLGKLDSMGREWRLEVDVRRFEVGMQVTSGASGARATASSGR